MPTAHEHDPYPIQLPDAIQRRVDEMKARDRAYRFFLFIRVVISVAAGIATALYLFAMLNSAKAESIDGGFFAISTDTEFGPCHVTGVIDKQKFLQEVPNLQKFGTLNPDLNQTYINTKPTTLTIVFTTMLAAGVTKETFENNPSVNFCSFFMNVKEADVYGHKMEKKILSYAFDRATFEKINWDQFEPKNMMKVAQKFSFTAEMIRRVEIEEREGR